MKNELALMCLAASCVFSTLTNADNKTNWSETEIARLFPLLICDQTSVATCSLDGPDCDILYEVSFTQLRVNFGAKTLSFHPYEKQIPFAFKSGTIREGGYDGYVKLATEKSGMSLWFLQIADENPKIRFSFTSVAILENDTGNWNQALLGECRNPK